MSVNENKMQFLCISGDTSKEIQMAIRPGENCKIYNQKTLKQLGFVFEDRPTLDAHIKYIANKFWRRLWYLRHMKKADVPVEDLIRLYTCFLVSVLIDSRPITSPRGPPGLRSLDNNKL